MTNGKGDDNAALVRGSWPVGNGDGVTKREKTWSTRPCCLERTGDDAGDYVVLVGFGNFGFVEAAGL